MAYFPSFGPFYDPENEQEIYDDSDGRLKSRHLTPAEHQNVATHRGKNSPIIDRSRELYDRRTDKVGTNWSPYVNPKQGDVYYVDNRTTEDSYLHFQRFASEPVTRPQNLTRQSVSDSSSHRHNGHGSPASIRTRVSSEGQRDRSSVSSHDRAFSESPKTGHSNPRNDFSPTISPRNNRAETSPGLQKDLGRNGNHVYNARDVTDIREYNKENTENKSWKDENFNDRTGNSHVLQGSLPSYKDPSQLDQSKKHYNVERWKDVILVQDWRNVHQDDSGVTLCEKLFGIILFQYNHKQGSGRSRNPETRDVLKDRKVIVQGVAPKSSAERSSKVHRGDMLISIDDTEVTWLNIDKIFRGIHNRQNVKLTLQAPVIVGPKPPVPPRSRPPRLDLFKRLTNHHVKEAHKILSAATYTLLYLTLTESSEQPSAKDDIVYMYPPEANRLVDIRGLFLTLNSSLVDVTNFKAKNSSVQLENEVIHLAYCSEHKDVLVLGLPAKRVPLPLLNHLIAELVRLLKFMFGGLSRAFREGDREQLDQLFALMFHQLLSFPSTALLPSEDLPSCPKFLASLCAVKTLHLGTEYQLICDEILNEFEAADFDEFMDEDDLNNRRKFTVCGCSLFYKDYQLCSHLPTTETTDIQLFLRHQGLLPLVSHQSVDEVVIWQEVWSSERDPGMIGYQTSRARCFLMVVGMKHFLLACVLEMGGCTQWSQGRVNPHTLYVDQAKATLVQLETDDVSMAQWCEECLNCDTESVSLVGAECYLSRSRSAKEEAAVSPLKPAGSPRLASSPVKSSDGVFKYRSSPLGDRKSVTDDLNRSPSTDSSTPVMTRQGSKLSYGSNDSAGSGSSTGAPRSKSSRKSFQNDISSVGKSLSGLQVEEAPLHGSRTKITRGRDNVLFNYVQLNSIEGVYIMPLDSELATVQGAIHSQLLENFYYTCVHIRHLFSEQEAIKKCGKGKLKPRFELGSTMMDVEEHGVLFQHTYQTSTETKKGPSVLTYWVIGRRFPQPDGREVYVCFHESAAQSLVELAFKLGFGILTAS